MRVCRLEQIVPSTGVCALVNGRQVAIFRVDEQVFAIDNFDPFSKANVLSRGIVGDVKGELVVASPVYKQHFSLTTGQCIEDPDVRVTVHPVAIEDGHVVVREAQKTETRSTCCYCGVGCGVIVESDGKQVTGVRGDPEHPANFGRLCTKGAALHLTMDPSYRLLYPELRTERTEPRRRASWDEAMSLAAERFRRCVAEHGPDSVAFYISGQLLTEDYYVFNKLAKGLIGTNNIDTNSRLCMSSAVAGYKLSLGVDAPPCCYEDIDAADLVLIAGSNTAFAHPILYRRIEESQAKVIVIDPRATVTARGADIHLALKPGTDVALFNALLHVIWREGLLDRTFMDAHTEGFAQLEPLVRFWTPQRAAEVCELPVDSIFETARLFAKSRAALSLYCQGLNQSANGTYKNAALINLHLATGQIGRPGAGPFSLTGQPNAMGGREVGGMANLLPAHRDLASEQDRMEVARLWSVAAIPAKAGKTAVELFQALELGDVRMVWIAGTNPAQSMPDAGAVRRALAGAEFVVVQDAFRDSETADYADVLLPAAGWAEKEGTVTNSERRISRVRAAVAAPGEARPDWQIAVELARRLGGEKLFPYAKAEDVFNEHRATTRGRDLDITGLSYSLLERKGPQQWPYVREGTKRLYSDGRFPTPTGRARFVATQYVAPQEDVDGQFPLRLNTGRLRDQWHTMTRTGTAARLFSHAPQPEVLLHPGDLSAFGLSDGELVRLASRRGTMVMKARASADMRPGDAFVSMHWGSRFTGGAGANALTLPVVDPFSKQPELKHAAISVQRFEPRWRRTLTAPASAELQRLVTPYLQRLDYAALTLDGDRFVLEVACAAEPDQRLVSVLESLFAPLATDLPAPAVCACLDVSEEAVRAAVAAGATLPRLQSELKAGTQCGSCVPELRCLLRPSVTAVPASRSGSARRAP